jgi:hypothetical protein
MGRKLLCYRRIIGGLLLFYLSCKDLSSTSPTVTSNTSSSDKKSAAQNLQWSQVVGEAYEIIFSQMKAMKVSGSFADSIASKILAGSQAALLYRPEKMSLFKQFPPHQASEKAQAESLAESIEKWSNVEIAGRMEKVKSGDSAEISHEAIEVLAKLEFYQTLVRESVLGIYRSVWTMKMAYPVDRQNLCQQSVDGLPKGLKRFSQVVLSECNDHVNFINSHRDRFPEFTWTEAVAPINGRLLKMKGALQALRILKYMCKTKEETLTEDLLFYLDALAELKSPKDYPVTLIPILGLVEFDLFGPVTSNTEFLREYVLMDQRGAEFKGSEPFALKPRPITLVSSSNVHTIVVTNYKVPDIDVSWTGKAFVGKNIATETHVINAVSQQIDPSSNVMAEYLKTLGTSLTDLSESLKDRSFLESISKDKLGQGKVKSWAGLDDAVTDLILHDPYALGIVLAKYPEFLSIADGYLVLMNADARTRERLATVKHTALFIGLTAAILTGHVYLAGAFALVEMGDEVGHMAHSNHELARNRALTVLRPELSVLLNFDEGKILRAEVFSAEVNTALLSLGIVAPFFSGAVKFFERAHLYTRTTNHFQRLHSAVELGKAAAVARIQRSLIGRATPERLKSVLAKAFNDVSKDEVVVDFSEIAEMLGTAARTLEVMETKIGPIADWLHVFERGVTTASHTDLSHAIMDSGEACELITLPKNEEVDRAFARYVWEGK